MGNLRVALQNPLLDRCVVLFLRRPGHPATLHGAEALGIANITGSVEVGKQADLVVVGENPLADWKVLFGTGAVRVTEDNRVIRTDGVRYTISRGIVYDATELREDVRNMVRTAWMDAGRELTQPGVSSSP